jgi:PAS domain S-box-containing protein
MKNILIVDDNPQDLHLLQTLLDRHGYGVTAAVNGVEALEKARSERPDMIIADVLMPVMDGFKLCREWKRDDRLKDVPFVFFTAIYSDSKDEEFALGLGAERFITKPQDHEVFLGMMEEVLSERKAARLAVPSEPQLDEAVYFREYNEALIRKLEDRMIQVEEAKRRLEREVAEHMRTGKALQRSVTYNRSLIEASLDPLVTIDAAGKITDVNSATEKVTGYPRERLIEADFSEYFTDPEKARAGYRRVFQDGSVQGYPLEIRHRDGSVTPVLCNASVYRDESGKVLGVFAAARDISEQKQVHIALQRREEELRTILRTATDGFWVTDRKGRFLEVNDAICRNLGYSRDELLRMSVSDIEAVEKPEEILRTVQRIMERGSDQFEGLHRSKDGSLRNMEISVNYLPPPHDRFFAFLRDITEHKAFEAQYFQARKMEAVGTLAGGIAHDFNNALTGIVGFGELLRMRMAGDGQALHDLDEILRCAERATTLTRQLLTYARRQVIEPVNVNLSILVADLMKLIGKVVGEHIEVKTSLGKNVPTIHADRGQIEQVVMNLCLNSRDAMPEGGRLVVETGDVVLEEEDVRRNPYMKTGRYALLTVSDTGVGMDEKTRERVFEPFFTTKGPDKGTGLGLAMVYGIVKQHGGFIHLYSEPGKGTAFKVYFPAVEAQPDAVPVKRVEEIVRGGTETILLAEDEEAIRSLGERALKELGYTVLVARDGEEAVEIFRQHKEIVLAVLDVVMPRKGGKEAFEEMHKQNPRLKVIFMSGYSADAIHDSFVLIPGTSFLQKPFGPTILARKVREALDTQ